MLKAIVFSLHNKVKICFYRPYSIIAVMINTVMLLIATNVLLCNIDSLSLNFVCIL